MGAEGRPGAARKVLEVRARTVGRYTPNRNHRMQEPDRAPCAVPLALSTAYTLRAYSRAPVCDASSSTETAGAAERPRPRGQSVRGTPPCTNGTWFGIGVRKLKSQTGNRANSGPQTRLAEVTEAPPRARRFSRGRRDGPGAVRGHHVRAGRPAAGLLVTCVSPAARAPPRAAPPRGPAPARRRPSPRFAGRSAGRSVLGRREI